MAKISSQDATHSPHSSQKPLRQPPRLVLVTAYGREDVIEEASAHGIAAVLAKPVNPSALLDTLLGVLNSEPGARMAAALYLRERTGQGAYIDVSMLEASMAFMTSALTPYLVTGTALKLGR